VVNPRPCTPSPVCGSTGTIGGVKQLLIITQFYYPDLAVGAHRAAKMCKFLPQFGWETTVLTAIAEHVERGVDKGLWDKIPPGTKVIRTPAPVLRHLSAWVKRQIGLPAPEPSELGDANRARRAAPTDVSSLKRLTVALIVPGPWVFWLPFAMRPAVRTARHCDAILSTSPYASAHLLARQAHRASGTPWIADFRDPWSLRGHEPDDVANGWHMRVANAWLERQVVREATALTFATEPMRQRYLDFYRDELDAGKCHCVLNGFDPDDYPAPTGRSSRLTGDGRNPVGLFRALRMLREDPATADLRFHVHLFGLPQPAVDQAARLNEVADLVTQHGMVSYAEALSIMQQCQVLLLIGSDRTDTFSIAGKFFEYVYAGPPILALVPEGPIAQLIREHGLGRVSAIQDAAGICQTLRELYERTMVRRDWSVPAETRAIFHRREQVRRLAEVLESAVGRRPGAGRRY
jgi:hypothetical protein